jgi:hypothetical protein
MFAGMAQNEKFAARAPGVLNADAASPVLLSGNLGPIIEQRQIAIRDGPFGLLVAGAKDTRRESRHVTHRFPRRESGSGIPAWAKRLSRCGLAQAVWGEAIDPLAS